MNKGFAYYFKQAFKIAGRTIWKNKNLLKSMLYFLTTLVARMTVFLGALVDLANVRHAKIAKNQQIIDVPQSLTRASQKPMWTMLVATVLEVLIYVGGFLLVTVVSGGIFAVGLLISSFVEPGSFGVLCIIFAVPGLIIYAVYTIIVVSVFAPTAYVIETNPTLSAGDAVSICVSSMKNRGKLTTILCVFVPSVIMGAIAGICAGGFALIFGLLGGQNYTLALAVIWGVISLVILCLSMPTFGLVKNVSLVLLFGDIALDPVNASKRTAGINIKKISGARVDREEIADNLDALFDDRIEEKSPDPADLVHKHKKKGKGVTHASRKEPAPAPKTAQPDEAPAQPAEEVQIEEIDDYPEEAVKAETAQPAPQPAPQPEAQPAAEQPTAQPQPADDESEE